MQSDACLEPLWVILSGLFVSLEELLSKNMIHNSIWVISYLISAMQMPGKGTFNVKPGQFTDDSELAAHMLEALCKFDPKNSLQDQQVSILFEIAQQYVSWYDSDPFDIGMATTNAMSILNNNLKVIKNE